MKACFKCGAVKPLSEFYVHPQMGDGHLGKCKACTRRDALEVRARRVDYYREYDRRRAQEPERKEALSQKTARFRREQPHKRAAHVTLGNAIRAGVIVRQPCEVCGDPKSHGHHEDYSKPLDVVWLCAIHHAARHREIAAELRNPERKSA